jgi:protein tyrosine phosphatase (PTP) superfamily phosphohydrolase (DUF442 family)
MLMAPNRPDERPLPMLPTEEAEAEVLAGGQPGRVSSLLLGLRQAAVQAVQRVQDVRPRKLDVSWVTDTLAVGGAFQPRDVRRLRAQGITAVLDLRAEAEDDAALLAQHGVEFAHLRIQDHACPTDETFEQGVEWVLTQQEAGRKVFIHCGLGAGRGPLMTAAVLVACGYRPSAALQQVRTRRWQAVPNARQLEGLRRYAQRCQER